MIKLDTPEHPNYSAQIVRVRHIVDPLPNSDNLVGVPVLGMQAVVSRGSVNVGDLVVVFPTECQLSEKMTYFNNLFRHVEMNHDYDLYHDKLSAEEFAAIAKPGYLEDNRRIKAIKLRKNVSNALVMPVSSLEWAGFWEFEEGDVFDHVRGEEICRKYVPYRKSRGMASSPSSTRGKPRVDEKLFPQHFESPHWLRSVDGVDPNARVIVTQKLHGTSIRVGNTMVKRRLSWIERFLRMWGMETFQEYEYDYVYGSRKVIKDANNPNQQHYYGEDLWTLEGHNLDGLLPKNYVVYGELVGYTSEGSPIQKSYTYDCLPGTRKLYVYRVAVVNEDGFTVDLSWEATRQFCTERGLLFVPELWSGLAKDLKAEAFLDIKFAASNAAHFEVTGETLGRDPAVPLAKESPCDEGICIRIEGMTPQIFKCKSPSFLEHETKMLDADVVDLETEQVA